MVPRWKDGPGVSAIRTAMSSMDRATMVSMRVATWGSIVLISSSLLAHRLERTRALRVAMVVVVVVGISLIIGVIGDGGAGCDAVQCEECWL